MRDVNAGWLLRYAHMNGASFFFIVTYIHIFRGLYYGSYKAPRELVWMLGLVIYLLMMATAFMGYVLPWGQMSYWGAQVITGFFSAFPLIGEPLRIWLLGGYAPDQAALTRFFSLHYLLPFVIAGGRDPAHLGAAHSGLGQPDRGRREGREGHAAVPPVLHGQGRLVRRGVSCWSIALVTYFAPNYLGHPDNYIPANPLATPAHIVPEWYFWPFYAILRSLHGRLHSAGASCGACWRCSARSCCCSSCRGSTSRRCARAPTGRCSSASSGCWSIDVIVLGYVGGAPISPFRTALGQAAAAYYFLHFLVILPLVSAFETPVPLPSSISESVLHGEAAEAAPAGQSSRGAAPRRRPS